MKKIGSRFHTHIHSQKNSVFFYTEQHILLEIRNRVAKINHQPGQKKKETNKEISIIRTHTHATLVVRFCCCFFFTFCQRIEKNNNWKGIERASGKCTFWWGKEKKFGTDGQVNRKRFWKKKKGGATINRRFRFPLGSGGWDNWRRRPCVPNTGAGRAGAGGIGRPSARRTLLRPARVPLPPQSLPYSRDPSDPTRSRCRCNLFPFRWMKRKKKRRMTRKKMTKKMLKKKKRPSTSWNWPKAVWPCSIFDYCCCCCCWPSGCCCYPLLLLLLLSGCPRWVRSSASWASCRDCANRPTACRESWSECVVGRECPAPGRCPRARPSAYRAPSQFRPCWPLPSRTAPWRTRRSAAKTRSTCGRKTLSSSA